MKDMLRKEILDIMRNYDKGDLSKKNRELKKKLENLPEFSKAKIIMFYVSTEDEAETQSMIKDALTLGKKVIIPYLGREEILLSELKDFNELEKGKFGILEPKKEYIRKFDAGKVDLIIAPGIVFDKKCRRIGFGEGYYDRLLRKSKAVKVGLAYDFQVVEYIPAPVHDVLLDYIVTDKELIRAVHK